MADLGHPKLVAVIVAAVIAVAVAWIALVITRWRRITWRDQMDAELGAMPKEARDSSTWAVWKVLTHHEDVPEPSLVLLRIRNSGLGHVGLGDVKRPLTLAFPGRVVKEFTVTDCRGVSRQEIQPPGDLNSPQAVEHTISLPRFQLRRGAGFKLLVLLSGPGRGIVVNGRLRRGSVLHESRVQRPLIQNTAFGSVLLLLIGVQAGITFSQSPTLPSYCASGKLSLLGSTAFSPTAKVIASHYTSDCPGASISVSPIATFNGLNAVLARANSKETGAADPGPEDMAMSDGPAPQEGYSALDGHAVAVIVFAVVVNRGITGVYDLTTAQLRGIFLGKITNWKQVGGPDLTIKIVARTTASGTRHTFDQKILGNQAEPTFSSFDCMTKNVTTPALKNAAYIRCEVNDTGTLLQRVNSIPGAIGYAQVTDVVDTPNVREITIGGADHTITAAEAGAYPYWTYEYLYTAGRPAPSSLAAHFLDYLQTPGARDILLRRQYMPCADLEQASMKAACGQ